MRFLGKGRGRARLLAGGPQPYGRGRGGAGPEASASPRENISFVVSYGSAGWRCSAILWGRDCRAHPGARRRRPRR
eukprot:9737926-Lingulodinium_polyedra.AAC.1